MKKNYKVDIPEELQMQYTEYELINYCTEMITTMLKKDFGEFALQDYDINFKRRKWETNADKRGHTWYYLLEVTENLETKALIEEITERLKIGL